jgi:hypothetical protein
LLLSNKERYTRVPTRTSIINDEMVNAGTSIGRRSEVDYGAGFTVIFTN